jgi:hypothetical protein
MNFVRNDYISNMIAIVLQEGDAGDVIAGE